MSDASSRNRDTTVTHPTPTFSQVVTHMTHGDAFPRQPLLYARTRARKTRTWHNASRVTTRTSDGGAE